MANPWNSDELLRGPTIPRASENWDEDERDTLNRSFGNNSGGGGGAIRNNSYSSARPTPYGKYQIETSYPVHYDYCRLLARMKDVESFAYNSRTKSLISVIILLELKKRKKSVKLTKKERLRIEVRRE